MRWRYAAMLVLLSAPAAAAVAETAPGTTIANVAGATYAVDGVAREIRSNAATLVVAERLDVALTRAADAIVTIAAVPVAVPVVLTNMGSGEEAFALHAESSSASAMVRGIAIDRDGDGRFDPASDTMVAGTTPPLAPGETLRLLVIVAAAGEVAVGDGTLTLSAEAVTGSGRPGAVFAGQGGGGGADAVAGSTGARAAIVAAFAAMPPGPTLSKAQAVRAPDGSADPVSGAVVTYTLLARFPATPTAAAWIDDPLPAGTIYLPGSLSLDGQALSDAADADAGSVAGRHVTVLLGDVPPGATRAVRFQIRLP